MNQDTKDILFPLVVIILMLILWVFTFFAFKEVKQELGQAICSERIGKDYSSYNDGILKCKSKELKVAINYDCIIIELENTR